MLGALTEYAELLPLAAVFAATAILFFATRSIIERRFKSNANREFIKPLILAAILFGGLIAVIVELPISDTTRGQLLTFFGISFSAMITLSSTTFLSNAMAGLMLRSIKSIRAGDFIRVDSIAGRVSERGLFHTEVQTEHRDLVTIPNLFLVTHHVTVIRSSGTFVNAEVSLGYDVPRTEIDAALMEAALTAELTDPFVQITKLGDFSVNYKVAGLLKDIKLFIGAQSRLRECMLDSLHARGIEIVSPAFMNQRPIAGQKFIPEVVKPLDESAEQDISAKVFDKADEAEEVEKLEHELATLTQSIEKGAATPDGAVPALDKMAVERLEEKKNAIKAELAARKNSKPAPEEGKVIV